MKDVTISFKGVDEISITAASALRAQLEGCGLWSEAFRYHAFGNSSLETVRKTGGWSSEDLVFCCKIVGDEIRDDEEFDLVHYLIEYGDGNVAYFAVYSLAFLEEELHPEYRFLDKSQALVAVVRIENFGG